MRYFYTTLFSILFIVSCSSVKKTTSSILSGDYDTAIRTSVDKLRRSPNKKNRRSHILLLEEAFSKAVQRDTDRITYLKKADDSYQLEEIYQLYKSLRNRQEQIKPLLPLRLNQEGRDAIFKFANYDTDIITSKNALTDYLYTQITSGFATAKKKVGKKAYGVSR